MIGTTIGYVGYDDSFQHPDPKGTASPVSIVLLDEIEKANPQVITLLLQVLNDGRLSSIGKGTQWTSENTVIIAASNARLRCSDTIGGRGR
ncbi:AAA family ATPase [Limosilactobacillus fermentum]